MPNPNWCGKRLKKIVLTPEGVKVMANLAAVINRELAGGNGTTPEGLEHLRKAGDKLCEARNICPPDDWKAWLKDNVPCSYGQACRYIRLAAPVGPPDLRVKWMRLSNHRSARRVESVE
jgi:hypothetical protein